MSQKNHKKFKPRVRYFAAAAGMLALNLLLPITNLKVSAISCPDVKIIFARGSGGERWNDKNYLTFKNALESKLKLTSINYEFEDLDYPAVGIGNPSVLLKTYIGAGEAYEFGASVSAGVKALAEEINTSAVCKNTKYVIGGYSQGAMVVSKAVAEGYLNADKIIYAAAFGDPKIYLPEGAGIIPQACNNKNLSDYRAYVPDCRAYYGKLGGYNPYQPEDFIGKLGTWCNKADFFCSSHLNILDHLAYVSDGLYEDASKMIFAKITDALGVKNNYVSPHDTAILLDSTGSMADMIGEFRAKAMEIARQTFASGGRVALYDYRDINEDYEPVQRCDFDTCTAENFWEILKNIPLGGGGDEPESVLSASLKVMNELKWNYGSTKSLVVLTDASFHSPDLDKTTLSDVVKLSKKIDPVNFYTVVPDRISDTYAELTAETDGTVMPLSMLSTEMASKIMARYDSLPRVEEMDAYDLASSETPPVLSNVEWRWVSESEAEIRWDTNGVNMMIALNDAVLGMTDEKRIILTDLDSSKGNILTLAPLGNDVSGISVSANLSEKENWTNEADEPSESSEPSSPSESGEFSNLGLGSVEINGITVIVPKVPDTGRR